jgi:hypothetical protein
MDKDGKKAKGVVLNGYLKFIKRKWGFQGMEDAMKYAGIEDMPYDSQWLPVEVFDRVLEWVKVNKGIGMVTEAARYSAKDLGVFVHLFTSVMSIESLLKRTKETYPTMFNYGDIDINIKDRKAEVVLKDVVTTGCECQAWKGGLIGLLELSRNKGTVVELPSENPLDCRYEIDWS